MNPDRFMLTVIAVVLLALTFTMSVAVRRLHRQERQLIDLNIAAPVPPNPSPQP